MIDPMNYLNVDAAVYGNHEFDFKSVITKSLFDKCNFKWLLGNLALKPKYSNFLSLTPPEYVIMVKNNVKIGIMGLIEQEWLSSALHVDMNKMVYTDYCEKGI